MKEINIAKVLVNKRKEKGITQDELANYIGVSKASVSKWETGQSYPDIAFLPKLAAYFNITIDTLLGYSPQISKEDIRKIYHSLSADFAYKPFNEVLEHCHVIIRKYFACFPLLLQMGILILNHSMVPKDVNKTILLVGEARDLFIRVRKESDDIELSKQALYMEASCHISLGEPNKALKLLKKINNVPSTPIETLLAASYQMTGKITEAKSALQIGIYQNVFSVFCLFPVYLTLYANEPEIYEEILHRSLILAEAFNAKHLYPSTLINLYLSAAQGYGIQGNNNKAIDMLQKYAEIVTDDIYPLQLHGDNFFNLLGNWLQELDLGTEPPRDEKTIKQSIVETITNNLAFSSLATDSRFQNIIEKLRRSTKL